MQTSSLCSSVCNFPTVSEGKSQRNCLFFVSSSKESWQTAVAKIKLNLTLGRKKSNKSSFILFTAATADRKKSSHWRASQHALWQAARKAKKRHRELYIRSNNKEADRRVARNEKKSLCATQLAVQVSQRVIISSFCWWSRSCKRRMGWYNTWSKILTMGEGGGRGAKPL